MEELKKCGVCSKEVECFDKCGAGMLFAGMSIEINLADNTEFSKEFIKKQMGDYETDQAYYVCVECLLKSLGVKKI